MDEKTPQEITALLGKHRRTLERELRHGMVEQMDNEWRIRQVYCADARQRVARARQANKGRPLKIGKDRQLARRLEEF